MHRVRRVGASSTPAAGRRLLVEVLSAATKHDLFVAVAAYAFNPEGMRGAEALGAEIATGHPGDLCGRNGKVLDLSPALALC